MRTQERCKLADAVAAEVKVLQACIGPGEMTVFPLPQGSTYGLQVRCWTAPLSSTHSVACPQYSTGKPRLTTRYQCRRSQTCQSSQACAQQGHWGRASPQKRLQTASPQSTSCTTSTTCKCRQVQPSSSSTHTYALSCKLAQPTQHCSTLQAFPLPGHLLCAEQRAAHASTSRPQIVQGCQGRPR